MESLNFLAPRSKAFVDWTEAYVRVENYYCSLRIRNKLLLSQLVAATLKKAAEELGARPNASPVGLAMEAANESVEEWFHAVLKAAGIDARDVRTKGRLALFLADLPARWQNEFLHDGPWPAAFLEAMKAVYLRAGPDFHKGRMVPREIDLGPVSAVAGGTWRAIDRWPILGAIAVWTLYLIGIGGLLYLLR